MREFYAIILKNGDNDYELCSDFTLTKEEKETVDTILQNHVNEGESVRGSLAEILQEKQS